MIEVAGIPVVELMDSQSPCLDIAVGFDNFEAARQMTAAVIYRAWSSSYRYLGARLDERTIIKQKGYEQAMRDAGTDPYSVMMGNLHPTLPVSNSAGATHANTTA